MYITTTYFVMLLVKLEQNNTNDGQTKFDKYELRVDIWRRE